MQDTGSYDAPKAPCVLVVDDDAFMHTLMGEVLGALGVVQLHLAGSAREALQLLHSMEQPPDYVISDVFMPDMDGFEFMDQLVRLRYAGGVVLVSGVDPYMLDLTRVFAKTQGLSVRGAYVKPVSASDLAKALGLDPVQGSRV